MIEFKYTPDGDIYGRTNVHVTTWEISLEEIVAVLERFLLACGYILPPGAHIGYEYDDESAESAPGDEDCVADYQEDADDEALLRQVQARNATL